MARSAAPAEVVAPPANLHAYEDWRKADTLRAPYKVGSAFLRGIRLDAVESAVECPLLCFINARSGGHMGAYLALRLSQAVGRVQVFDIGEKDYRPDKVLSRFYDNLRTLEAGGDPRAAIVRQRLRLLVCGGDGTIAWVMGVVKKLKLQPEPPIAIMPLGTGNDLSRSFRWGAAYSSSWIKDREAMYNTLNQIATATEDRLDCWNITITAPRKTMFGHGVPHCLSPPQPPAAAASLSLGVQTPHGRLSVAQPSNAGIAAGSASNAGGYNRGYSSGLNAAITTGVGGGSNAGPYSSTRDASATGDRSAAVSIVATFGSATPLQNIATSSVGSAATTFTTATNMSMHTGAAQAGTSVPPTIVSGAVSTSAEDETGIGVVGGSFWNYFSVGLDAKAAWGFHSLREERPQLTSSRMANQFWYTFFSCTSGWFCCAQPVNLKVTLEVLKPGPGGEAAGWQSVKLPSNVKALIVLNLQSYAGGRNLWGPSTTAHDEKKRGYKKPTYNDGLLEVVGLRSGWHTSIVMGTKGTLLHAKRICQAAGVRLAISAPYVRGDGEPSHCYMQVDGEPWKQDIPVKGQEAPVRVEIVHAGVSRVLRNEPRKQSSFNTSKTSRKSGASRLCSVGATVSAVSEPAVISAPSQSSIQISAPVPQSALQVGLTTAGMASAGGPAASISGALQHQVTHGSQSLSGVAQGAWTRIGSAGRPSTASAAGSSSAAGVEPFPTVDGGVGGALGAARGVVVSTRQDATDGGSTAPIDSQFPAIDAPTPRTLSTDLGSQGGRSIALQE
ncbi:hypothetical protein Vretimale_5572 [Volvox reticuliferus]|uniref:Diacylglycerol kinase n=1 Tax=Volvox reticuliferus TaxID=1737510 RepID=A0A8J4C873_9CHLO|nr:hypothetical protein Vretifemale_5592 [Volvox reticuliferus]GIM00580.1 hypothetical protein Vretimale_5572 [Volvox reticuliferus]